MTVFYCVALYVVNDERGEVVIRRLQYLCARVVRADLEQLVYFIILQRVFKYLMCFIDFALYHQYYAQDIVRF